MSDLLERLKYQNVHSVQRTNGSYIFGEAIEVIELLRGALEQYADLDNWGKDSRCPIGPAVAQRALTTE